MALEKPKLSTMLGNYPDTAALKQGELKPQLTQEALVERALQYCDWAVARGLLAWFLWRGIYLSKLPGMERKIRVLMDWTIELFFPRDIVQTIDLQ